MWEGADMRTESKHLPTEYAAAKVGGAKGGLAGGKGGWHAKPRKTRCRAHLRKGKDIGGRPDTSANAELTGRLLPI